jgi:hypothetical protein
MKSLGVGSYLEFRNNLFFYKDLILLGNRAKDAPHWSESEAGGRETK